MIVDVFWGSWGLGMEEIRRLREDEIDAHLAISQFAFQYEIAKNDLDQAKKDVVVDHIHGFFVDGQMAANLTILPLATYVNGHPVAMGGIAGVATWPEHRRRGMVAKLLRHSLNVMKEQGSLVSMLAPFSFAFYNRFGWVYCIDRKQYILDRADWPKFQASKGAIERTDHFQEIASVYETYAARFSGTLQRSEDWWQTRIKKGKQGIRALYRDENGVAQGYMIYQVKQSEMIVHEMVYLTVEAYQGLWNFIANHDSMANQVKIIVPTNDGLPFLLPNPRIKQEIFPYFMARIVDVEPFLRQYSFISQTSEAELNVCVTDPNALWNEAIFTISWSADGIQQVDVQRVEAAQFQEIGMSLQNCLTCDIQTLTAMLFGYQRPSTLASIGSVQGTSEAVTAWEQAIPAQTTFLYDFF